jgi:hypothetical protein
MEINPPFGYSEIVPLRKDQKLRLPATGVLPEFCRAINAVPISYSEFAVASRDYPLAFVSADDGKNFAAVAVLGIAAGENLFLARNEWDEDAYLPAYVRRHPFCMARLAADAAARADRVICVEKAFLSDEGEALFDAQGAPTERWTRIDKLLREYEADLEHSGEMCAILADYALLEPFTFQGNLRTGSGVSLGGMYRVAEAKLEHLNAAQHKNLIKKGVMGRVYAHLISLGNFTRLLARKNRQATAAAAPQPG